MTTSVEAPVPELWHGPLGRRLSLPAVRAEENGTFVAPVDPAVELCGTKGAIFGGWLACVIDHVAGVATAVHIGPSGDFLTADLRVRFLRPVGAHPMTVVAEPRSVGSRLVDVSVRIEQSGVVCCEAELTQAISRRATCVSQ